MASSSRTPRMITKNEVISRIRDILEKLPPRPTPDKIEAAKSLIKMKAQELAEFPSHIIGPDVAPALFNAWMEIEMRWSLCECEDKLCDARKTIQQEAIHGYYQEAVDAVEIGDDYAKIDGEAFEDKIDEWKLKGLVKLELQGKLNAQVGVVSNKLGLLNLLEEIDISGNHITVLPASLGDLRRLRTLNVEHNDLDFLPSNIGHCVSLVEIRAAHNEMGILPESLEELTNLRLIDFGYNRIQRLSFSTQRMINLQVIDVSFNDIKGIYNPDSRVNGVAEEVCLAKSLVTFNLSGNHNLDCLPDRFGDLISLEELDISQTRIEELPDSFRLLSNLREFKADQGSLQLPPPDIVASHNAQDVVQFMKNHVAKKERKKKGSFTKTLKSKLGMKKKN